MKKAMRPLVCAISMALACTVTTVNAETVEIAVIDGFSGPFAPIGVNQFSSLELAAEIANEQNWAGEHNLKFVRFDNKGSPHESITQLQAAIDKGFRYISQGGGSAVGLALIEAINRHNQRNPGKEVIYLNHASIDPAMTNSNCSFWHFAFDSNTDMKLEGLTSVLAEDKNIKKVYIIGQNYSHGQHLSRATKELLKAKRPDIEIVGDDLHPTAQVKDFAPYIAKIRASGAQAVITGNWGTDLALLIRAAGDANLDVPFYTFYGSNTGVPTAMGGAAANMVKTITYWNANNEADSGKDIIPAFKQKYNDDFYQMPTYSVVAMLSKAIKETGSIDPVKVAFAMEDMSVQSLNGEVTMRASDHQVQQPLYITVWTKADGTRVKYDQENTGYGWLTEQDIPATSVSTSTTCNMKRPARP